MEILRNTEYIPEKVPQRAILGFWFEKHRLHRVSSCPSFLHDAQTPSSTEIAEKRFLSWHPESQPPFLGKVKTLRFILRYGNGDEKCVSQLGAGRWELAASERSVGPSAGSKCQRRLCVLCSCKARRAPSLSTPTAKSAWIFDLKRQWRGIWTLLYINIGINK